VRNEWRSSQRAAFARFRRRNQRRARVEISKMSPVKVQSVSKKKSHEGY
jgi:hypothetical protein